MTLCTWQLALVLLLLLLATGTGTTSAGPQPASSPAPADSPKPERIGAAAVLPSNAADGHTPTFAFTVAPAVDLHRSYSYDEFVSLFGTSLQALDLDVVDMFEQLDKNPRDSHLAGAEVHELANLLEDKKRAARQAVSSALPWVIVRHCCNIASPFCATLLSVGSLRWLTKTLGVQKEDAPLSLEDFEERYARWLKLGSFKVFEQLDTNSDQLIDSAEIRELNPASQTHASTTLQP